MATPQEIVNAAYLYMMQVMALQAGKISNPRVEELSPSEQEGAKVWNVVISYDVKGDFDFDKTREYKQFTVDDATNTVLDMKIKKV